jgi:hypothetical protein
MVALSWLLVAAATVALIVGLAGGSSAALVVAGVTAMLALVPLAVSVVRHERGRAALGDGRPRSGPTVLAPPPEGDGPPSSSADERPDGPQGPVSG